MPVVYYNDACGLLQILGTVHSAALPLLLWLLYLSVVNLGSMVINYGWEWLTLEAGFLAIFLCPILTRSANPASVPPPAIVLWLFRWLGFRVMIGAGMSKLGTGSSKCWQVVPSPLMLLSIEHPKPFTPEFIRSPSRKSPRREVVRSSAGAGVVYPPFLGSFA